LRSISGGTEGRPRRAYTASNSRFIVASSASTTARSLRKERNAGTRSSRRMSLNIAPWKSWSPLMVLVWVVRGWLQIVVADTGAGGGFFNGL
jgi:hypothetical protein